MAEQKPMKTRAEIPRCRCGGDADVLLAPPSKGGTSPRSRICLRLRWRYGRTFPGSLSLRGLTVYCPPPQMQGRDRKEALAHQRSRPPFLHYGDGVSVSAASACKPPAPTTSQAAPPQLVSHVTTAGTVLSRIDTRARRRQWQCGGLQNVLHLRLSERRVLRIIIAATAAAV
jgi:hypothetical protein